MVSGKKRNQLRQAEPSWAGGTSLGRRNQLGQAELAWTGGGVRPNPPTPPPPPSLRACITSPLCSAILSKSCHQAGAAVLAAEARKLDSNGLKCQEFGWSCIPLAAETYGNCGKEAHDTFSRLESYLAIHQSSPKSAVVAEIYVQLNIALHGSFHCKSYLARELLLGCALVYNRLYSYIVLFLNYYYFILRLIIY